MGVADGGDGVRGGVGGAGEHVGQPVAGLRGGAGDIGRVDGVGGAPKRVQDLVAPR